MILSIVRYKASVSLLTTSFRYFYTIDAIYGRENIPSMCISSHFYTRLPLSFLVFTYFYEYKIDRVADTHSVYTVILPFLLPSLVFYLLLSHHYTAQPTLVLVILLLFILLFLFPLPPHTHTHTISLFIYLLLLLCDHVLLLSSIICSCWCLGW